METVSLFDHIEAEEDQVFKAKYPDNRMLPDLGPDTGRPHFFIRPYLRASETQNPRVVDGRVALCSDRELPMYPVAHLLCAIKWIAPADSFHPRHQQIGSIVQPRLRSSFVWGSLSIAGQSLRHDGLW